MSLGQSNVSPQQFGDDYYNSLQSLTFNSRPIIESHTSLAQENTIFAPQIVEAIERRIDKAIPSQKLFNLYLLDSISKNIGLPYTNLFSHNIFKTFTKTYGLVDDQTRCKLIKLFKTWKLPTALTGLPLFDSNQLDKIEQFLIKVTASSNPGINLNSISNNSNPNSANSTPLLNNNQLNLASANTLNITPIISQQGLIKETEDLLVLVNSRLQSVPNDEKGQQRFKLLNQLKSILSSNSSIPKSQLNEVAKQLQTIRDDEILKLNTLKQQQKQKQQQQQQQQQQNSMFSTSQLQNLINLSNNGSNDNNVISTQQNQPPTPAANALFNMMNSVINKTNHNNIPPSNTSSNNYNSNSSNLLGLKNISFLENMLKKPPNSQQSQPKVDFKFIRPTKQSIVEDFTLNQNMINNHIPTQTEISLLYEFKPIQCDKCPKRFEDSQEGKIAMQKHSEWHLRVEQRLRLGGGGLGGVVNRSWYLTEIQWIEFDDYREFDDDNLVNVNNKDNSKNNKVKNNGNIKNNKDLSMKSSFTTTENNQNKTKDNDYRERNDDTIDLSDAPNHIVRIPESLSNEVVCGICHEKIIGTFDEDSGDWIWRNAIEQRGKIYHWTCWIETKRHIKRDRSPQRS